MLWAAELSAVVPAVPAAHYAAVPAAQNAVVSAVQHAAAAVPYAERYAAAAAVPYAVQHAAAAVPYAERYAAAAAVPYAVQHAAAAVPYAERYAAAAAVPYAERYAAAAVAVASIARVVEAAHVVDFVVEAGCRDDSVGVADCAAVVDLAISGRAAESALAVMIPVATAGEAYGPEVEPEQGNEMETSAQLPQEAGETQVERWAGLQVCFPW